MLTFTVPESLRGFLRSHQRIGYEALFQASAGAIKTLAADPKFIGGDTPGFLGVLHTWGRQLQYHPHIHFLVPGGGGLRAYAGRAVLGQQLLAGSLEIAHQVVPRARPGAGRDLLIDGVHVDDAVPLGAEAWVVEQLRTPQRARRGPPVKSRSVAFAAVRKCPSSRCSPSCACAQSLERGIKRAGPVAGPPGLST